MQMVSVSPRKSRGVPEAVQKVLTCGGTELLTTQRSLARAGDQTNPNHYLLAML